MLTYNQLSGRGVMMSRPSITLVAGSNKTRIVLHDQLDQLLGDYVEIHSFAVDEGLPVLVDETIVVYSSKVIYREANEQANIRSTHTIVGKRTINHEQIDKLFDIPENSNVLLVNDDFDETVDFIESLYQLGINHIQFVPFRKGQLFYEHIDFAVSPGETQLCPPIIKNIIDINVRLFDMTTILKIVDYCELNEGITIRISERYIRNIVELQRKLLLAEHKTKQINEHLQDVVNSVDDGILAINQNQEITVFNHRLKALFQQSVQEVKNMPLTAILGEEITDFILTGEDTSKFFTINGIEVVLYRFVMSRENTIVTTFKSVNQAFEIEKTAQRQLRKRGFYAKYDLTDIIGEHPSIKYCKQIAKKLAISDHPILIHGETGTGKELFANAMHRNSMRKNGPFLAINCSALTENLLESELFGYEEGSFTGAQRGGKKGLFELADNGTIFLDEIGDISLSLQAHLLRVLQEHEIRRIGGNKIIPINVRIIAATNKDLRDKIRDGSFRPDLYYRLNVLNFTIPPLRERKSDIPLLVDFFKKKSGKWVKIDPLVLDHLVQYEWLGNIRELKSVMDYMLTVCENSLITENDLPDNVLQAEQPVANIHLQSFVSESVLEAREYLYILEKVKQCNDNGKAASRDSIAEASKESSLSLTSQQVRKRLDYLEQQGLVKKGKGRAGTKITLAGVNYLKSQLSGK